MPQRYFCFYLTSCHAVTLLIFSPSLNATVDRVASGVVYIFEYIPTNCGCICIQLNADLKSVDEDKDRVFAKLNDEVKAKEDLLGELQL